MAVNGQLHNRISLKETFPVGSFSFAGSQGLQPSYPPEMYPLLFALQHFSKEIILYIAEFGYSSRPESLIININSQS